MPYTVPADTFFEDTKAEANQVALDYAKSCAESMLYCMVDVAFSLDNGYAADAWVTVSLFTKEGEEVGTESFGKGGESSFSLDDGRSYDWYATFYHPTNPPPDRSGAIDHAGNASMIVIPF